MKFMMLFRLQFALVLLLFTSSSFAQSAVLLTLESASGQRISLTREELESLPQTTFTTSTPWTKGIHSYQGPKLNLIIDKLSQPLNGIRIYALNGYSYDIGIKDLQKYPFVLALQQDSKNMTLRNKGPLWVLVPFDQNPKFISDEKLLNQSVWQVNKIRAL
ncbi:hypothetical protein ACGRL8_10525 [Vibrio rumoiensis]|uniref:hypothetical protein n=1 Tax=Vibrio rumoiensis TaxID=76258 RepID=UPI000B5CCC5E|nr:hypothetical protein [Vibrio rumoiensis]